MGLVNLKTDLKSLKYGRDRKGGGSSNQPYITTPIPDDLTYNGPDFLLRQGALQASLTDSERLTKWFSDPLSVNGLLFTAKQNLLERLNPKIYYNNSSGANPLSGFSRVYLPTSTISQAGLLFSGAHLNKQGLDPFALGYYNGGSAGYYNAMLKQQNVRGTPDNRLTIAYTSKIANQGLGLFGLDPFGVTGPTDTNNLLIYDGGPNAPLGLGNTRIRLAGNGAGLPRDRTNTYKLVSNLSENYNQVYAFDNNLLSQQESKGKAKTTSLSSITDYRKTINNNNSSNQSILPFTDYEEFNRETTYKTSVTYYTISNKAVLFNPNNSVSPDGINAFPSTTLETAQDPQNDLFNSDLVKFFFEVINPNVVDKDNNTISDFLFFRAYLTNIGDGFKADWQPYKYVGRAESFYKYTGFSRDVSLSFIVYAHSRVEMIPLYEKLNKLVGTTAPTYGGNGYMLGNFVKLTVGTYFNGVPGVINNINLKPSFEAGWDINRDEMGKPIIAKDKSNVGQIPRMIEVDLTFTPIHDFVPQYPYVTENNQKADVKFINNTPKPKTDSTPTPSSTTDTTNTPAPPDTSTFGIVDPTITQLQNSLDSSGNPVDWGANTPQ